jgi:hypothetical protein
MNRFGLKTSLATKLLRRNMTAAFDLERQPQSFKRNAQSRCRITPVA